MTEQQVDDLALAALLAAAAEAAPDLPQDLVRKAYAIQRLHQFDPEDARVASKQAMEALLADYVEGSTK